MEDPNNIYYIAFLLIWVIAIACVYLLDKSSKFYQKALVLIFGLLSIIALIVAAIYFKNIKL